MPLESGKSQSAFKHNVEAEIAAGKSQKQSVAIAYSQRGDAQDDDTETGSAREVDANGYITIDGNPITRAGVFQYKGSQLPDGDPERIYNVYRPLEEVSDPAALKSMQLLPLIDEHEMVGDRYARGAEERGVHGSTGENISVQGMDVLAPIRIFSKTLKRLVESGKKGLSLGYNCVFEKSAGEFNGIAYDYIQRNIRGNHLALVNQGRSGTEVLDHMAFDHFDLALDTQEKKMAEENKGEEADKKDDKKEFGLKDVHAYVKDNAPMWHELKKMMGEDEDDGDDAMDADTKEEEGDQKLAKDKAKDKDDADEKAEDEEKEKEEEKEAMDAAIATAVRNAVASERKSFIKTAMADVAARDKLAKELAPHIGTFACDTMDLDEVAAYGAAKLELNAPKGQERAMIAGFLQGASKAQPRHVAMDSVAVKPKAGSLLASRLASDAK